MLTKYETSFTVYPTETNPMSPLIFGGAFFSQLDKAAATVVRRAIYSSDTCETSVTHKWEGTFHKPCYLGDLIHVIAEVVSMGHKSVVVEVKAKRENPPEPGMSDPVLELVAEAKFVFVTVKNADDVAGKPKLLPYVNHGLTM